MTKPSKRQTNCPSWFFIHFQWGFRKQYSPPPRLFFNLLNCSLVFLNAVSSLSSNSKSTHMHTHEHTALLKSTVRSPTYEPKLQTLKRCERGFTCPITQASPGVWRASRIRLCSLGLQMDLQELALSLFLKDCIVT